jgi:hypothetical protein
MTTLMEKHASLGIYAAAIHSAKYVSSRLSSSDLRFAHSARQAFRSHLRQRSCPKTIWRLNLQTNIRRWWRAQISVHSILKSLWGISALLVSAWSVSNVLSIIQAMNLSGRKNQVSDLFVNLYLSLHPKRERKHNLQKSWQPILPHRLPAKARLWTFDRS